MGQNFVASVSVSGRFAAMSFFFSDRRLRRSNAMSLSTSTPVAVSFWANEILVGAARATTIARCVSNFVVTGSPCYPSIGSRLVRRRRSRRSLDHQRNLRGDLQVHQGVQTPIDLEEERRFLSGDDLLDRRNPFLTRLRQLDLNVAPPLDHADGLRVGQGLLVRRVVLDHGVELVIMLAHGGGV